MLWTEWTNSMMHLENDPRLAKMQLEQGLAVFTLLKDKKFVEKLMDRLEEMGVTDFNPEDLRLRLVSQAAQFYLNHPAARNDRGLGIKLLEKEILPFEIEDYGAAYLLADIKIQMGKPREAVSIVKPALADAESKNFLYNTGRLGVMLAKAVIAGGLGPRYRKDVVEPILKDARKALKGCRLYTPKGKYEMYYQSLVELEQQVGVGSGGNEHRATFREAEEVKHTFANVS
jgi:hypothetical protein